MYKYAIALFCAIALLAGCFCKKEDCPKAPDYIKYAMYYKGGEQILFQNFDYQENRLDTINVTISRGESKYTIPCSHPDPDYAGSCNSSFSLVFNTRFVKNLNLYNVNKFNPEWSYQFYNNEKEFRLNYEVSTIKIEVNVNGIVYKDVNIDSLNMTNPSNKKNTNVLYWTQKEGLILARKYKNDTLKIEMRKI
jgi:hypothetical protein